MCKYLHFKIDKRAFKEDIINETRMNKYSNNEIKHWNKDHYSHTWMGIDLWSTIITLMYEELVMSNKQYCAKKESYYNTNILVQNLEEFSQHFNWMFGIFGSCHHSSSLHYWWSCLLRSHYLCLPSASMLVEFVAGVPSFGHCVSNILAKLFSLSSLLEPTEGTSSFLLLYNSIG